jgi:predicted regulator of Ras-like GTPase activity (Roadblock/LC7/MglB family)
VASLTDSLRQVMALDGVRAAALVDIATGMLVRSEGEEGTDLPAVAATMADEVRLARSALGPGRPGGDLEEISLVTAGRVHMTKILGARLGEGIFLFVDVDRARVNMALASLRVGELVPAVLA